MPFYAVNLKTAVAGNCEKNIPEAKEFNCSLERSILVVFWLWDNCVKLQGKCPLTYL